MGVTSRITARAVRTRTLRVAAVAVAATRDWEAAFDARLATDRYGTAGRILELIGRRTPEALPALDDRFARARQAARARLVSREAGLLLKIRRAQRHGALTDLEADRCTLDVGGVRALVEVDGVRVLRADTAEAGEPCEEGRALGTLRRRARL